MLPDWLFRNPVPGREKPYSATEKAVLSLDRLADVERALAGCPVHRPTPLYSLGGLARELAIGAIYYKNEGRRFGFGAFKALGGVYAVGRQLLRLVQQKTGKTADLADLASGLHREIVSQVTVTAASSGNHGRAVAAGARIFGCRATILLPGFTSPEKETLIRARGADVVRVDGDYDQALEVCRRLAQARNWLVISDTSWPDYVEIPRDVMQAYGVVASETTRQLAATTGRPVTTHLLLQAGVGGLAAGVSGTLWERFGRERPQTIVVEPQSADCFLQSARAGRAAPASGDAASAMGGLACREVSPQAWAVLQGAADWFCTVPEEGIAPALRRLAVPVGRDRPVAAGPSGSAGLQALLRIAEDGAARRAVGLESNSSVLLIGSENAAGDPGFFADAVGLDAATIEARGEAWDRRNGRPPQA